MRHLTVVVLGVALAAQGPIYVVDISNGPGAHYTQIQAAVLAVPAGSTLVVRPGSYNPITIDAKAITILGAPGATFVNTPVSVPWLFIRNTQTSQTITVRGLQPGGSAGSATVENAAGPVTVDGAGATITGGGWPVFAITASAQVDLREWVLVGTGYNQPCTIVGSTVVFERCTLRGAHAFLISVDGGPPGGPALRATNSHVQLVHTAVYGGNGLSFVFMGQPMSLPGGAAVELTSSHLRAMGLPGHEVIGGSPPGLLLQRPAIVGTGVARVEPQIPLSGPPSMTVQLTRPAMPSLLATSSTPGGTMTVERHGPAGVLTAVAISLRAPASSLPPLPDPLWLAGASLVVEAAGVTAGAPFVVTKFVPNQPTLVGFQCVWQAADLDQTGLLAISNPTPSFVR